jgi:single-strand DNA-binding protein
MNNCQFLGRLAQEPISKDLNGTKLVTFTLSVEETWKDNDGVNKKRYDYLDFEIWDSGAETIYKHAKKGDYLVVNASARQQKWNTPEGDRKQKISFRVNHFKIFPSNKED